MRDEIIAAMPKFGTQEDLKEFIAFKKDEEKKFNINCDSEEEDQEALEVMKDSASNIEVSMINFREEILDNLSEIMAHNNPDKFTLSNCAIEQTIEKFDIACLYIENLLKDIKEA